MFSTDQYELLDFGGARKLERFGPYLLDRPSPPAEGARTVRPAAAWAEAHARFDRDRGAWRERVVLPETWTIRHDRVTFELRRTEFGHVGLVAEQAATGDGIARQLARLGRPAKVLNLFAYTGGSTLAASAAGAEVVHIDSARNAVQRARRNAELSGLADRPVRWIAEDAAKFVARERRRGNGYDAVILDPPSYGHGPGGEPWKLDLHLDPMLRDCAALLAGRAAFVLLTCHTPGYEEPKLRALLRSNFGDGNVEAGALSLESSDGRRLSSGHFARWTPKGT